MNQIVTFAILVLSISSVVRSEGHGGIYRQYSFYAAGSGNHVAGTTSPANGPASPRLGSRNRSEQFGSSPTAIIRKSLWHHLHKVPFKRGDEFETSLGSYAVAVDEDRLIFMRAPRPWQSGTTLSYLHRIRDRKVKIRDVRVSGLFDIEVGLALAQRLVGRKLPFDSKECNGYHYITYFIDGLSHQSKLAECPLNKSLVFLSVDEVKNDAFELVDAMNRSVKISSLPWTSEWQKVRTEFAAGRFKNGGSPLRRIGSKNLRLLSGMPGGHGLSNATGATRGYQ